MNTNTARCNSPVTRCRMTSAVVESVRAALQDSVEHHFVSDVPVGIFLSGGIDSTALLALASAGKRKDIRTFCIRFAERAVRRRRVGRSEPPHTSVPPTPSGNWTPSTGAVSLNDFLTRLDQPTIDGFNTFIVSKFAHEQGMKVVLSGLGGDELFGGYPSFLNIPRMVNAGRRLQKMAPAGRLAGAALERFAPKEPWRRLGHFLREEPNTECRLSRVSRRFPSRGCQAVGAWLRSQPGRGLAGTATAFSNPRSRTR